MSVREQILVRLIEVMKTLAPIRSYRNADDVSAREELTLVLFDGDEMITEDNETPRNSRGDPRITRDFMAMTPSISLIKGASTETIGTELNGDLSRLQKAIVNDAGLIAAIGTNGTIKYTGCSFEAQSGEERIGRMTADFRLVYPFDINAL